MLWRLLWLLLCAIVVIVVSVLWLFYFSVSHCPSCGIELRRNFWGEFADSCVCGWHRRDSN